MSEENVSNALIVEVTSEIVSAYVSHNSVPPADLVGLIRSVHNCVASLGAPRAAEPAPAPEQLRPAVPVRKSVTDDYIISLEDGRKFKSMKRYLAGLNMTPAEYRAKWGLPGDYPMVAPSYAAKRSELARSIGLGRKSAVSPTEGAPAPDPHPAPTPEVQSAPKPKRTRKAA